MRIYMFKNYQEYRITIGNADFTFFSDIDTLSEQQNADSTVHSHKFYEIFYVLRGYNTIITENREFLLQEGDAAIVSPEVTHTTKHHPDSLRISMVFTVEKNPKVTNSDYYDVFCNILNSDVVQLNAFVGSHAFRRFARYFQCDYSEKDELITSCLHEIISLIKVSKTDIQESTPKEIVTDTNNYRNYIIDDYFVNKFREGSLINLAEMLQLSPQQTQRIIKKMYNQSFSERITVMKMSYAKSLLLNSTDSVAEIAEKCGYNGTNGFFVAFKKYYGKTPNELRKSTNE